MVQVKDVLKWIDARAPFRYAESWDNCGLQVGDPEASVKRVLVALDPSSQSFQEAENLGCQCLVTTTTPFSPPERRSYGQVSR